MTGFQRLIALLLLFPAAGFAQEEPVERAEVRWLAGPTLGTAATVFSVDGDSLFTADAGGKIIATGTANFEPHPPRVVAQLPGANRLAASPSGNLLAVHTSAGEVWLLNSAQENAQPERLGQVPPGELERFAFSSDGGELILLSADRRFVWQLADKSQAQSPLVGADQLKPPVSYSATGRYAAGANEFGGIVCIDTVSGGEVALLEFASEPVSTLAFSSDNGLVAGVTAERPAFIQVWELPSGKRIKLLPVAGAPIARLGFVADDTQLLALSQNGDVLKLGVAFEATLRQLQSDAVRQSMASCTWSPDGTRLSVRGTDGKAQAVGVVELGISAMSMGERPQGFFLVPVHYATNRAHVGMRAASFRARLQRFFFSQWGWGFLIVAFVAGKLVRWRKKDWRWSYATTALVLFGAAALHTTWYERPTSAEKHRHTYSAEAWPLEFGLAEVSVPDRRPLGSLELPTKFWIYEEEPNPEVHFILQKTEPQSEAVFHQGLNDRLKKSEGTEALVFVHGYNVSFDDALLRTAQLAVDLQLDGPACAFSWPSYADALKYTFDATNAEVSIAPFQQFLSQLVKNCQADRIHVVAHSMGNRVVTRAIANLRATDAAEPLKQKVHEIVLAAPDIDERVFTQELLPAFVADHHVTLYASSHDWALTVSKWFNGFRRAGDTVPEVVVRLPMDTVDASEVDTSFLGHSYYGDERSVVTDLFSVLRGRKPTERFHLKPYRLNDQTYWRLSPPKT